MGLDAFRNLLSDVPQSALSDATNAGLNSLLKNLSDTNASPAAASVGNVPAQVTQAIAPAKPLPLGASGNASPTDGVTKEKQPNSDPWYVTYKTHLMIAGAVVVGYFALKYGKKLV